MDKLAKVRAEVEKLNAKLLRGACSSQIAMETMCKEEAYNEVLAILDTMQDEPVSEELEKACEQLAENARKHKAETSSPFFSQGDYKQGVIDGAKWQKEKDEFTTEDLGEYINELSKQFPEVSFAKLSRIAVRVAKWQKEKFEKERLKHCDELTDEQAQIESDFVTQHLKDNNRTPTFIDAIEYGMKMQNEQMMAKAVDGVITFDYYGDDDKTYGCIAHDSFCLEDFGLKDTDKVKMILIKED